MMDIRRARQIAFDINLKRYGFWTYNEVRDAYHRLLRSQPEKGNKMILRSDKQAARDIMDSIPAVAGYWSQQGKAG